MKKTVLLIAVLFQVWTMNAQTKCDSIKFHPDIYYITQGIDQQIFDSLSYVGDNYLDYALCSYRIDENPFLEVNGTFATPGVIGPYELKNVLGTDLNYQLFVTPPNTQVTGVRIVSHWSMTTTCEYPITFIINPSIASGHQTDKDAAFKVYPNPAVNEVTVEFDKAVPGDLILDNVLGKTVQKHTNISGGKIGLNTKDLVPGIYFVKLQQEGRTIGTQKLLISK